MQFVPGCRARHHEVLACDLFHGRIGCGAVGGMHRKLNLPGYRTQTGHMRTTAAQCNANCSQEESASYQREARSKGFIMVD